VRDVTGPPIRVEYSHRGIGLSKIDEVMVYPLVASVPVNARISPLKIQKSKVIMNLIRVDLLESLIGSLVLIKRPHGMYNQVSFLLPNTSTLSQFASKLRISNNTNESFDLASNPFKITKGAAMIYMGIDLTSLYEVLWRYILLKFISDINSWVNGNEKILTEYSRGDDTIKCRLRAPPANKLKEIENEFNEIINSTSAHFQNYYVNNRNNLFDVKALFKAFVYPHVSAWSVRVDTKGTRRPRILINGQPLSYLGFSLPLDKHIIGSIINNVDLNSKGVFLRYLRLNSYILDIFVEEVFNALASYANRPYLALLISYCRTIMRAKFKRISEISRSRLVEVDLVALSHALSYSLLEMGLHGIAHCLKRYVSSLLKINERYVKEFLGIVYLLPNELDFGHTLWDDLYVGVAEGYIFRYPGDSNLAMSGRTFIGVSGAIVTEPFSYNSVSTLNDIKKLNNIMRFCDFGNPDMCYSIWMNLSKVSRVPLLHTSRSLLNVTVPCNNKGHNIYRLNVGRVFEKIIQETERRFELGHILKPDDLGDVIYLSRLDYRRILSKKLIKNIIKNYLNNYIASGRLSPEGLRLCSRNVKNHLKPYLPLLYESLVPHCFDGCYNCVIIKNCGTKHPIIREWVVSKSMTKLLLEYIKYLAIDVT